MEEAFTEPSSGESTASSTVETPSCWRMRPEKVTSEMTRMAGWRRTRMTLGAGRRSCAEILYNTNTTKILRNYDLPH